VLLTGVQSQPNDMLRTIKIVPDLIAEECICRGTDPCMKWLAGELEGRSPADPSSPPPWKPSTSL